MRLEKKREADRWIAAVRTDEGRIVASPEDSCTSFSFGYDYDPNCFYGSPETPSLLVFECALAQSVFGWIQSLIFRASSLCPSLLCRHVFFGFSSPELAVVSAEFSQVFPVEGT